MDYSGIWKVLAREENSARFEYVNDFICKNTRMYYEEKSLYDIIGITPFTIQAYFPFSCRAMMWANNKIRIVYHSGVAREFRGISWNSSLVEPDFDPQKHGIKDSENVKVTSTFNLKRISYFKSAIKFEPSSVLDGINAHLIVFQTMESHDQTQLYGNWTFPTPQQYDEFWFDKNNTEMMLYTNQYELGKEQI